MKSKKWIKPLLSVLAIVILCISSGFLLLGNLHDVQAYFTRLPYEVRGYPQGDVVLIGSSVMDFWHTSESDLGPLHTVNVGIPGTVVEEWEKYTPKLVEPFSPRAVVMYVGSNDISGEENSKTGDAVAAELKSLFDQLHKTLPDTPLYYISITPTLKRFHVWDESERCNQLVAEMAEEDELLTFVDCREVLSNEDGTPKQDIFVKDGLHLNEKGYALWTQAVRPVLVGALDDTEVA